MHEWGKSAMPKRPKGPWFRKQTGQWYVTLQGRQIPVGEDKEAAWRAFYRLNGIDHKEANPDPTRANVGPLVGDLVAEFLTSVEVTKAPRTYQEHNGYLSAWLLHVGPMTPFSVLAAHHLTDWLDTLTAEGTRRNATKSIKRCFNWAAEGGRITHNPFARVKRSPYGRRQVFLTAAEQKKVVANWTGPFRDFVEFALETGSRPQEIRILEARHFHGDRFEIDASEAKGGHVTSQGGTIYLTAKATKIAKRLVKEWPEGPIFRNERGQPWDKNSINNRFKRARAANKIPKGVTAYTLRHSFATSALKAGIHPEELRVLMRHSSLEMIAKHYSHLAADREHMKDAAKRARRPKGRPSSGGG